MLPQQTLVNSSHRSIPELATRNITHRLTYLPKLSGRSLPIMADVDMTDAPPVAKKKGTDVEAKKRFEVKKVSMGTTRS